MFKTIFKLFLYRKFFFSEEEIFVLSPLVSSVIDKDESRLNKKTLREGNTKIYNIIRCSLGQNYVV